MYQWETEAEFIGEMLLCGAAVAATRDDEGELMIKWDLAYLRENLPEIYDAVTKVVIEENMSVLVDKGLVDMSFREDESGQMEAIYSVNEKGQQAIKEILDSGFDF